MRAMQRRTLITATGAVALAALGGAALHTGFFDGAPRLSDERWAALKTYCTDCHSAAEAAGGVVLEGVAADAIPGKPEVFEAAVRKLRGGLMPPPGNPRPEQADIDAFIAAAEHAIDRAAPAHAAGHVPAQRLNRTE